MSTTAKDLRRWLDSVPDSVVVQVRVGTETRDINSILTPMRRDDATDELVHNGPAVLSGNYYGA